MIDPVLSIAAAMSVQSPFTGKAHIDQDAIVSENRDLGLLGVVVLIFKLSLVIIHYSCASSLTMAGLELVVLLL